MADSVLLYQKILQTLRERIDRKELLPGDKLPTEMELAEEFGVSRITSKRALEELRSDGLIYRVRGRGSFVTDRTSLKGAAAKREGKLDYSEVIAFVIPFSCANGGIMDTVKGASRILAENGYILDVRCSNNDVEEERELLESLYQKGFGGIIYYPISDRKNLGLMNMFCLNEYPIISIDKYFESVSISYVVSDNQKGEYDAVKYLIELGHKNIAFLSDTRIEDATSVRNRYFGYCKALKESSLAIRPEFMQYGDFFGKPKDFLAGILQSLLDAGVTAFCCINDYVATLVIQSLKDLGVDVPEDVSVIGFDDLDVGRYIGLTTVRQDMEYMGEYAARYLVECLTEKKCEYRREVIPVTLTVRGTAGGAMGEEAV